MRSAWLLLAGTCAWACSNDFDDYRFRSDQDGTGGSSASGGSGGTSASGGTGALGATGGTGAMGGAAGASGGSGGATGGAGGASGGSGGATGGAAGASGGAGGSGGAAGAGGQGGSGGSVATCEQLYQGKPGVNSICDDTPQVCELNFSSGAATCNAICAAGGGECQGVFDNNGPCNHGQPFTCGTTVLNDGICVCSHGCGSGPPCPSGQTCDNGNCN